MAKKPLSPDAPIEFNINDLVGEIQKLNPFGRHVTLGSAIPQRELVPFYHHVLNLITYNGFPFGCIHEFFGHSQTGKCLVGSTLLTADNGAIYKMSELIQPEKWTKDQLQLPEHTLLEEDAWYICKNSRVFRNGEGKAERAYRWYYGGKQKCISLLMDNGLNVTGTPEHVIPVASAFDESGNVLSQTELSLEEINKRVNAGEEVKLLMPVSIPTEDFINAPFADIPGPYKARSRMGEAPRLTTGFILGYLSHKLLLDQRAANGLRVVATTKAGEAERINATTNNQVVNALSLWNYANTYNKPSDNSLNDPRVAKWFADYQALGTDLRTVEVPACIRTAHPYVRFEYIRGLLNASSPAYTSLHFTTYSKAFAHQLNALLLGLGIVPLHHHAVVNGRVVWEFTFLPYQNELLLKLMNPVALSSEVFITCQERCYNENILWREIDPAPEPGSVVMHTCKVLRAGMLNNKYPVYDLEMPETHHYTANGFASHNSFFMYRMAAEAQRIYPNTVILMIDKENAYNADRGAQLSLNNNQIIYYPAYTVGMPSDVVGIVEDVQNYLVKKFEKSGVPHVIAIVDSIAAFKSGVKRGSENMGKSAKHWHEAFREAMDTMFPNVMMLVSNHVTFNPNVMFGSNLTKAQANATNYYRSCGIGLEHGKPILDENGDRIGEWLVVVVDKSRQGPSYRKAMIPFFYDQTKSTPMDGYLRFLAARGILQPKNVDEFKKCKQKTLIYKAPNGESFTMMEDKPYEVLAQFPQLYYTEYPKFGGGAWASDLEQDAIDTIQSAFNTQTQEDQILEGGSLMPVGGDVQANIANLITEE